MFLYNIKYLIKNYNLYFGYLKTNPNILYKIRFDRIFLINLIKPNQITLSLNLINLYLINSNRIANTLEV
jgi:hypothetical protein